MPVFEHTSVFKNTLYDVESNDIEESVDVEFHLFTAVVLLTQTCSQHETSQANKG